MRKVRVLCVGVSPLMMDRMSDEVLESLDTGVRLQIKKDRPVEEKAEEKIYRNSEGRIGLSPDMLLAALVNSGRNVKIGKKQVSTAATTMLFDFFQLKSDFLILTNGRDGEEPAWVSDRRRGVSNQSKSPTAVCIVRPQFPEWAFEATFTFDEKTAGRDTMMKLFKEAGSSQGLGSFRPNRKGRYGMFVVQEWHEETLATTDTKILVTVDGTELEGGSLSEKATSSKKTATTEVA